MNSEVAVADDKSVVKLGRIVEWKEHGAMSVHSGEM